MTKLNNKRGHELEDHRIMKLHIRDMLLEAGFDMSLCEYRNVDAVGIRNTGKGLYVLAVEVERTVRNVLQNIWRDLAARCDRVLVVCMSMEVETSAARLVDREWGSHNQDKVWVINRNDLKIELLKALNGGRLVDSGFIQVSSEGLFRGNPGFFKLIPQGSEMDMALNSQTGRR